MSVIYGDGAFFGGGALPSMMSAYKETTWSSGANTFANYQNCAIPHGLGVRPDWIQIDRVMVGFNRAPYTKITYDLWRAGWYWNGQSYASCGTALKDETGVWSLVSAPTQAAHHIYADDTNVYVYGENLTAQFANNANYKIRAYKLDIPSAMRGAYEYTTDPATTIYTVTFCNDDGTVLETVYNVAAGSDVTYSGSLPQRSEDASDYRFIGWSPAPTNIQANTVCYAQYHAKDIEISDSWDQILAAIDDGTYTSKYFVGDYKPISLGSEGTVNMQIAAVNGDALASGGGTAPITFITQDLLATKHGMNPVLAGESGNYTPGTGSIGGWGLCQGRDYLKRTIKPLIPESVRNRIVEVTKYTRIYDASGQVVNNVSTTDDVWMPSEREIFGDMNRESEGVEYTSLFDSAEQRIKKYNNTADIWWLRTAFDNRVFRMVSTVGTSTSSTWQGANTALRVAFGFCLGTTAQVQAQAQNQNS